MPRKTKVGQVGPWAAVPTILVVSLFTIPSVGGSPATFGRTFRAPFPAHGGAEYNTNQTWGANTGYGSWPWLTFNLTTGALPLNQSGTLFSAGPNRVSYFWFADSVGVQNLTFRVPITGYYNVTSRWAGAIWANLSVLNKSTGSGYAQVSLSSAVGIGTVSGVGPGTHLWVSPILLKTVYNGTRSLRISVGKVAGPHMVWLSAGTDYTAFAYFTVLASAAFGGHPKPSGARASLSISSPSGIDLKYVAIA